MAAAPLHSLALIAAMQQVLGLAMAVLTYALLRRHGLPGWGATLATLPVLFGSAELLLERLVMGDLLAMMLMVAAFVVLLWRVFLPGPLLALVILTGLTGLVLPGRRAAGAALPWLCAAASIVLPVAEHEYVYRYVMPAVPLLCLAAALRRSAAGPVGEVSRRRWAGRPRA